MDTKIFLATFVLLFSKHLVFCAGLQNQSNQNETAHTVEVLARVFPPFTHFNSNQGFFGGLDILASRTIAKQLHLRLVFTKTNNLASISNEEFE